MQDEEIVALYWRREESAIRETEDKYGAYLRKLAYNLLADREDSEESVNDTYFRAWNAMPPHRPAALSTFLAKITRNLALDRLRRRHSEKRRPSEYEASLSELEECVTDGGGPEETVELQQLAEAISAYLYTLSEESRSAFVCRYFFGDSIREIASYCGAGESKIKSMLHRARLGLKKQLEQEGFL